jgi:hypothetical protein
MKITIQHEDGEGGNGKIEVHQNVTDYYLAVRKMEAQSDGKNISLLPETRSFSFGSHLREIAKEVAQSLLEINDFLRTQKRGDS